MSDRYERARDAMLIAQEARDEAYTKLSEAESVLACVLREYEAAKTEAGIITEHCPCPSHGAS
jgi:hypothetical protein